MKWAWGRQFTQMLSVIVERKRRGHTKPTLVVIPPVLFKQREERPSEASNSPGGRSVLWGTLGTQKPESPDKEKRTIATPLELEGSRREFWPQLWKCSVG